jgi:hypothetical protein
MDISEETTLNQLRTYVKDHFGKVDLSVITVDTPQTRKLLYVRGTLDEWIKFLNEVKK